jgi:hypothetical protein
MYNSAEARTREKWLENIPYLCFSCMHQHKTNELLFLAVGLNRLLSYRDLLEQRLMINKY